MHARPGRRHVRSPPSQSLIAVLPIPTSTLIVVREFKVFDSTPGPIMPLPVIRSTCPGIVDRNFHADPRPQLALDLSDVSRERSEPRPLRGDNTRYTDLERRALWKRHA